MHTQCSVYSGGKPEYCCLVALPRSEGQGLRLLRKLLLNSAKSGAERPKIRIADDSICGERLWPNSGLMKDPNAEIWRNMAHGRLVVGCS